MTPFEEFAKRNLLPLTKWTDAHGEYFAHEQTYAAWRAWEAATARAIVVLRGVNNSDNPMTANDCADEIAKGLEPVKQPQQPGLEA